MTQVAGRWHAKRDADAMHWIGKDKLSSMLLRPKLVAGGTAPAAPAAVNAGQVLACKTSPRLILCAGSDAHRPRPCA